MTPSSKPVLLLPVDLRSASSVACTSIQRAVIRLFYRLGFGSFISLKQPRSRIAGFPACRRTSSYSGLTFVSWHA